MKRATANHYLSQYILLRDAIERSPYDKMVAQGERFEFITCCTCGKLMSRFAKNSHAGHFISKGMGGSSGVYFDERNVHAQCHNCNKWQQGNAIEYYPFMLEKYGQEVIDELRRKHHLPRPHSIDEYGIMYREKFKALKKKYGLSR